MHGGSRHGSRPKAKAAGRAEPRAGRNRAADAATGHRAARGGDFESAGLPVPAAPLPDASRLTRLLEPVVHAMNMDLESIKVTAAGRRRLLRVVVDADGGVSLDDIALASRELSARLDSAATMGELPYTLEVSSPGVERPLTQPRHWRRAIGRLVVAPVQAAVPDADTGNGAGTAEGRIVGSSDRGVTLERDGVTRDYAFAELGPGRVQVEFGHFDADPAELDGDPGMGEED